MSSVNLPTASRFHLGKPAHSIAPFTSKGRTLKMQCFICVTYMMVIYSINLTKTREIATDHGKRSLFHDVIESIRMHSRLPEDINHNDGNKLSQNFERYEYDDELSNQPDDYEYIPRRNDRIEMPSLKYRFPRNINKLNDKSKEQLVLYVNANTPQPNSQKPNIDSIRQRPYPIKTKFPNKVKENNMEDTLGQDDIPFSNTMGGQSQIGNRESQTVIKPTVIVNIRGSIQNKESNIKLEARDDDNSSVPLQNIFNINQEVNISTDVDKKKKPSVSQEIKLIPIEETGRERKESVLTCETATWKSEEKGQSRKLDVLQILFAI